MTLSTPPVMNQLTIHLQGWSLEAGTADLMKMAAVSLEGPILQYCLLGAPPQSFHYPLSVPLFNTDDFDLPAVFCTSSLLSSFGEESHGAQILCWYNTQAACF